ncbi:hypothetical protein I6U48_00890 [Clostridium sp. PL3]|uniref:Restriction endonuclease type IV Mrr domain-containing protein n=1 Tax=Clostridium thailandense TaxID=2794346 RepID=A0A949WPL6_9CLOT|nr:hypothetical protein [Clostridium thailandense]MBV7271476.1 hypothetical protein [Clostridium thailandense]
MVSKEKILELLNTLHEHTMAKDIFVPVLKKMKLGGVKFTGGPEEQGIDIEYYELTEPEKHKSYVGIQFKKGDLIYSGKGSKNSVKEVKNQAEEAFEKEIHDIDLHGTVYISRFVVATTGDINEKARTFIGRARQKGNDRRIDYWIGDRLAEYIQTYWITEFMQYFHISEDDDKNEDEEFEDHVVDSEYIYENYKDLISKCERVRGTISGMELDILKIIIRLKVFKENSNVTLSDLLFELGKSEDYISNELNNLARKLEYLEFYENDIYIKGKASFLVELAMKIIDELIDAEEETESAEEIFDSLIS